MTRIKQIKKDKGVSTKEILALDGVDLLQPQYSLIETGKVLPIPAAMRAMCDKLGCSPADMYDSRQEYDLVAVERDFSAEPVRKLDIPSGGNPRISVRLAPDRIESLEMNLRTLGYKSLGQYVRKVVIADLERKVKAKVEKTTA